jgi:hypothetical protein
MKWIVAVVALVGLAGGLLFWLTRSDEGSEVEARVTRDLDSFQKMGPSSRDDLVVIVRPLGDEAFGREHPRQDIKPVEVRVPNVPPEHAPLTDLFVGNLSLRYAIDGEQTMRDVSPSMLKDLGLERDKLLPLAVKNLHRRYPDAEVRRADGLGMVTGGGDLESSWMLDFDFWKQESKRFKGTLVASVPSREVMVWADSAKVELLADLRSKGEEIVKKEQASNRALSSLMYAWRDDHWEVFAP